MLDAATPDFLTCVNQRAAACMNAVFDVDGACGGAIMEIGCTAEMRSDAENAHSLAMEMYEGGSTSSLGPQFLSAVNKLRADFGLSPINS